MECHVQVFGNPRQHNIARWHQVQSSIVGEEMSCHVAQDKVNLILQHYM